MIRIMRSFLSRTGLGYSTRVVKRRRPPVAAAVLRNDAAAPRSVGAATVGSVSAVLVFFVSDPVDDELAAAVRARVAALRHVRAWSCPAPGFVDDPAAEDPATRTTGGYVRDPAPADVDAALGGGRGGVARARGDVRAAVA